MAWLRESDNTMTQEGILRAYDFEDIQLLLHNDRDFMYPVGYENMTAEEKMKVRKERMLKIARKELMDSVRCAMEILEEYAEDLIKITAPREKVIDGEVKTLQGWKDNGKNFSDYVKEGEKVAVDIVNYFIELLPPRSYEKGFFQVGEPYDRAKEGARYATFIYLCKDDNYGGEIWMFKGNCLAGTCEKGTEIPIV